METMNYGLGCLPDTPDPRDHFYEPPKKLKAAVLPDSVDMIPQMPFIYNQLTLGSCTAHPVATISEWLHNKTSFHMSASRLFLYLFARDAIGTRNQDSGATIRDTIKVLADRGVPPELWWPYKISRFTEEPPMWVQNAAIKHRALSYARVGTDLASQQACLASGFPFIFGFTVYSSFFSIGRDGMMPMPKPSEAVAGGHAVLAVGYDNAKQCLIVRNSWGSNWGKNGYFYMPYEFATQPWYAFDQWVITATD